MIPQVSSLSEMDAKEQVEQKGCINDKKILTKKRAPPEIRTWYPTVELSLVHCSCQKVEQKGCKRTGLSKKEALLIKKN